MFLQASYPCYAEDTLPFFYIASRTLFEHSADDTIPGHTHQGTKHNVFIVRLATSVSH